MYLAGIGLLRHYTPRSDRKGEKRRGKRENCSKIASGKPYIARLLGFKREKRL